MGMTSFYVPHVATVDLIYGLGLLTLHLLFILVNPAARIQEFSFHFEIP